MSVMDKHTTMVSCQKGPTRHAYAWQIGLFWQDTLDKHIDISNRTRRPWFVHNFRNKPNSSRLILIKSFGFNQ